MKKKLNHFSILLFAASAILFYKFFLLEAISRPELIYHFESAFIGCVVAFFICKFYDTDLGHLIYFTPSITLFFPFCLYLFFETAQEANKYEFLRSSHADTYLPFYYSAFVFFFFMIVALIEICSSNKKEIGEHPNAS